MIAVTGPTSFIGRSVLPKLAKRFKKKDILCLCWDKDDEVGIANRQLIEKLKLPIKYIDIVTKEGFKGIPKSPKTVIHMAANTDTSTKNHVVNDIGTKNFLKSLGNLNSKTHIIYTSTTTFMGGRTNCSQPLDETGEELPTNEYGRSKLRAEKYLVNECKKKRFRLTVLRLNTVYGPNSRPKSMFKLLPEQIKNHSLFTRLNWPGLTSIVHVEDVADAICFFTKNRIPKPGIPQLYILSGESLTMAQMSKLIHKELKIPYKPINLPAVFWKLTRFLIPVLPILEKILPANLYNPFWRASLIIDNALWFETDAINNAMPKWKPRKLKDVTRTLI